MSNKITTLEGYHSSFRFKHVNFYYPRLPQIRGLKQTIGRYFTHTLLE